LAYTSKRFQQLAAIYQQKIPVDISDIPAKILKQIDALPQQKPPTKQRYVNVK
jgi:hypothetical protein